MNRFSKTQIYLHWITLLFVAITGSDSNLLIVFYVQIMPDDLVMQLHRF
ncbi:Permease, cytosine/purine, uracil, thiamine, allantoin family [Escherichia coli]|nr:Permease, cytosine/purine, uracil, thiamine, allantoin family [Escherichia coli]